MAGAGDTQELMAHGGERRVVHHAVDIKPPRAQHGSHEGGDETADVDEHIENLEARIALRCVAGIVVQLTHDSLKVAFEKTVAEGYEEERHGCHSKKHIGVVACGHHRHGEHNVAEGHDDKTPDDGAFVVLRLVGDGAAHKAEHIDAGVEHGVDQGAFLFREAEFGAQEEHQHCIHDVVAETFAHVAQGRWNKAFGMVFKHNDWY